MTTEATQDRNNEVIKYVNEKIEIASRNTEDVFLSLQDYENINNLLIDLIEVKALGFRGVVVTALVGIHLNPKYNPLKNFYGCSPRAIFENGIYIAFDGKIPCGKSDPLNVAKNVQKLDLDWAKGKRPQRAAEAVVSFLLLLQDTKSVDQKELLIDFFFFRLYKNALAATSYITVEAQLETPGHSALASKLALFTLKTPEGGAVPQKVISLLLRELCCRKGLEFQGGDDSVYSTNTTSKKPADMWLSIDGVPENLYEITVKKVDLKRLDDCISSVQSLGFLDKNIFFICRIPEDTTELNGMSNNSFSYKGKLFNFTDIEQFILSSFTLLTSGEIASIFSELNEFMNNINRPVATKESWNTVFG